MYGLCFYIIVRVRRGKGAEIFMVFALSRVWRRGSAGGSDGEHDLADMVRAFEERVPCCRLGQREGAVDLRPHRAALDQRPDLVAQRRGDGAFLLDGAG